jgi:hypothetical protein
VDLLLWDVELPGGVRQINARLVNGELTKTFQGVAFAHDWDSSAPTVSVATPLGIGALKRVIEYVERRGREDDEGDGSGRGVEGAPAEYDGGDRGTPGDEGVRPEVRG